MTMLMVIGAEIVLAMKRNALLCLFHATKKMGWEKNQLISANSPTMHVAGSESKELDLPANHILKDKWNCCSGLSKPLHHLQVWLIVERFRSGSRLFSSS